MNTDEEPLVSVYICTSNRSAFIDKAIKSILMQEYSNIQIIVSDAGNDDTEMVVCNITSRNPEWKNKIHYFKNSTKGIAQNRNFSLQRCSGKYIAVLDSDDYWISSEKIRKQVDFLEKNTDYALVGSNAEIVNSKAEVIGQILNEEEHEKINKRFLLKNQFVHSSVLFRKDLNEKYDEEIVAWEDYDLCLRIAQNHKVANLPEKLTAYREHAGNFSNSKEIKKVLCIQEIIKKNKSNYPNYLRARILNMARLLKAILVART